MQFQWTVYDFGRRTGRYNQAAARQRITEYRLIRAEQTVQFDVAVGYLNILLAQASLRVQEEAVRQAEATLKDARARLAGDGCRTMRLSRPRTLLPWQRGVTELGEG